MHHWLRQAILDAGNEPERVRPLLRHQDAVGRLRELDPRDRWGYPIEDYKLAVIADFVVENVDQEALGRRAREHAAVVEAVDRLALQMSLGGGFPQVCDGYDEPASDETIQTIIRTTLNLKEPSHGG